MVKLWVLCIYRDINHRNVDVFQGGGPGPLYLELFLFTIYKEV